jgi:hypothetical protein
MVPFPVHLLSGLGLCKELRDVLWRPELGRCSGLGPALPLPLLLVAAAAVALQLALQLVRVRLVSEQKGGGNRRIMTHRRQSVCKATSKRTCSQRCGTGTGTVGTVAF